MKNIDDFINQLTGNIIKTYSLNTTTKELILEVDIEDFIRHRSGVSIKVMFGNPYSLPMILNHENKGLKKLKSSKS